MPAPARTARTIAPPSTSSGGGGCMSLAPEGDYPTLFFAVGGQILRPKVRETFSPARVATPFHFAGAFILSSNLLAFSGLPGYNGSSTRGPFRAAWCRHGR